MHFFSGLWDGDGDDRPWDGMMMTESDGVMTEKGNIRGEGPVRFFSGPWERMTDSDGVMTERGNIRLVMTDLGGLATERGNTKRGHALL